MKRPKLALLLSLAAVPLYAVAQNMNAKRKRDEELAGDPIDNALDVLRAIPTAQPGQPAKPAQPPQPGQVEPLPPPPKPKMVPKTPEEKELVKKLGALVKKRYGGDPKAAFDFYAGSDGLVSKSELEDLLDDAGVGNFVTRSTWAKGVIKRLDTDGDGRISWVEYQAAVG